MSSRRPTPAFARVTDEHRAPYGTMRIHSFYVLYQLNGQVFEEVVTPPSDQSIGSLLAQLGVGPNDWLAEPIR